MIWRIIRWWGHLVAFEVDKGAYAKPLVVMVETAPTPSPSNGIISSEIETRAELSA